MDQESDLKQNKQANKKDSAKEDGGEALGLRNNQMATKVENLFSQHQEKKGCENQTLKHNCEVKIIKDQIWPHGGPWCSRSEQLQI